MCFKIALCSVQAVVNLGGKVLVCKLHQIVPKWIFLVCLSHAHALKLPYLVFDVTGMLERWVTLTISTLSVLSFQVLLASVLSPLCSPVSLLEAKGGVLHLTSCTDIILVN